ncbi:MAG: AMIN domain-containing protein [Acidobacteria bacterium]|nr:AMIN domain-containing protein [Acidobacteriota bacterium]
MILAAILLGVAGGIWLAERRQPASRTDNLPRQASTQPFNPPAGDNSQRPKADPAGAQMLEGRTSVREPVTKTIRLGLPSIRSIQHSDHRDFSELAIELRSVVLLRAAPLHDPERVYFDFAQIGKTRQPKGRLRSRSDVPVYDDRVAGVRVARWESGAVRVVVDLRRSCEYSYRLTGDPVSRIVVHFRARPQGALASESPTIDGNAKV